MDLNEYLYKTNQILMKKVLMYINTHNHPNLSSIKNNEDISLNADDYEWAVISELLLSIERYLDDNKIENSLTNDDINKIESLLSESEEILPGDNSRQTPNCILDDTNTALTFNYLINDNSIVNDFLDDLDYYESDIDTLSQNSNEDKKAIQELKNIQKQIIQKQSEINKANDLIISNGKLNTIRFVKCLRNALAHSHYVPYNEDQLRFFIHGESSNHFNAIIDKKVVIEIVNMICLSACSSFIDANWWDIKNFKMNNHLTYAANWYNEQQKKFENFYKEIIKDFEETLNRTIHQQPEKEMFLEYYDKCKNAKDINEIIDLTHKLNDNSYTYQKDDILEEIDYVLRDEYAEDKKSDILFYLEELDIENYNPLEDSDFELLYSSNNFEAELYDRLCWRTGLISKEDFQNILIEAKKNPDYNNNDLLHGNKIKIILDITKRKIDNENNLIKIVSRMSTLHRSINTNRIDLTSYKFLIMSLLKCNFLDGYNINENTTFETLDFSKFKIPYSSMQEYEQLIREKNNRSINKLEQKLQIMQNRLNTKNKNINEKELELANSKVNNEYFSIKLPQIIAKFKEEYNKEYTEYAIVKNTKHAIDELNKNIFDKKNLNPYIMRHLRNSLAHGNIDIQFIDKDVSKAIVIFKDIDENNKLTFECNITLIDLLDIIASNDFQKVIFDIKENTNQKAI